MKKAVSVQRTLVLSIALTGDKKRDLIALNTYNFEGIKPMFPQKRDMVECEHEPKIFLVEGENAYSHSMKDNELFIWLERINVESIDAEPV